MMKLEKRTKKRRKFNFIMIIITVLVISSYLIFYINSTGEINNTLPANAEMNLKKTVVVPKKIKLKPSNIDFYKHIYKPNGHKIAYLTFDDGPSFNNTPIILRTLDKYNVKATFFIVGSMAKEYPDLVRKEFADGQSIGNHSYSHDYNYIYSNTNTFINDINKCNTVLKSILGNNYNTKLVRFPGGSFGKDLKPFRDSINNEGYNYVDWNDLTGEDRKSVV